jgi:hypothetical protein
MLVQIDPGAHPASCTMGIGSLSRKQRNQGEALITHLHPVQKLKKG